MKESDGNRPVMEVKNMLFKKSVKKLVLVSLVAAVSAQTMTMPWSSFATMKKTVENNKTGAMVAVAAVVLGVCALTYKIYCSWKKQEEKKEQIRRPGAAPKVCEDEQQQEECDRCKHGNDISECQHCEFSEDESQQEEEREYCKHGNDISECLHCEFSEDEIQQEEEKEYCEHNNDSYECLECNSSESEAIKQLAQLKKLVKEARIQNSTIMERLAE